ncbi:unnamed protein product [Aspergillus oryzae]|nr:unnamed protein product [Aspergillus oryzae]
MFNTGAPATSDATTTITSTTTSRSTRTMTSTESTATATSDEYSSSSSSADSSSRSRTTSAEETRSTSSSTSRSSSRSSSASANDSVDTTASSTSFAQGGETGSANAAPVITGYVGLEMGAVAVGALLVFCIESHLRHIVQSGICYIYIKKFLVAKGKLLELGEIGSSETSDGIPALSSVPASVRHDGTTVRGAAEASATGAANASTEGDILQTLAAGLVQPGVQEAESGLAGAETGIVQESDDGAEGRGGGGGAVELAQGALVVDGKVHALGCDVGESTAGGVVEALESVADRLEVAAHGLILPFGTGPVVGETARGEVGAALGSGLEGGADGGDPRASGGELGWEVSPVGAVVGHAALANTRVTGGEENGDTAAAKLSDQVADGASVLFGDFLNTV